jgi:hypothetical protein
VKARPLRPVALSGVAAVACPTNNRAHIMLTQADLPPLLEPVEKLRQAIVTRASADVFRSCCRAIEERLAIPDESLPATLRLLLQDLWELIGNPKRLANDAAHDAVRSRLLAFLDGLLTALRDELAGEVSPPPVPVHPTCFREGKWDLRESGFACYDGIRFPLEGMNRRLLARLIQGRGRAVNVHRLAEACGDVDNLSPYVSRLRKCLRTHLRTLSLPDNPIPFADPEAYRLDLL